MKFDDVRDPVTGHFQLVVCQKGVVIETIDEPNLVVDGSKLALSKLTGGAVTGFSVTTFGVGTNGSAPMVGNTLLTNPFTKAVDTVSYPASNKVRFNFSLASNEANGKAILEFGLLTANGTLFARKIRSVSLSKESDITISGSWTITF